MRALRAGLLALLALAVTAGPVGAVVGQNGVSPDTVYVAASGDDGQISCSGASYPPIGLPTADTTSFYIIPDKLYAGTYGVYVGLLRWDTSFLPDDAIVLADTLVFREAISSQNPDGRQLTAEWYPASNWPIDATDWTSTVGTDALAGSPIAFTGGIWYKICLDNATGISLIGYTGMRLHISGGAPVEDNYVIMSSKNATYPAYLIISWTLPPSGPSNITSVAGTGTLTGWCGTSWSNLTKWCRP